MKTSFLFFFSGFRVFSSRNEIVAYFVNIKQTRSSRVQLSAVLSLIYHLHVSAAASHLFIFSILNEMREPPAARQLFFQQLVYGNSR
jgi:hypothetical protein